MEAWPLILFVSVPFFVLVFLIFRQALRDKKALKQIMETFEKPGSLVYPNKRILYKNYQPPFFTGKGESRMYYRFNLCRLIANPDELLIIGIGGWNNKPITPVFFVKSKVSSDIPVGSNIFICEKTEAKGDDIEITFYDRMRVPEPVTLVIKRVDVPLCKHLLEHFS